MLLSSLLSPSKPMPMRSFNVCSTAVFRAAVFMIAAITALCRMLSSTVGEFRQYFFPKSRRLMHRHTIFFLPPAVHVHSSYALYFYKRAVTAFQSLPVCYGGTSGFQCYLFMPTLFFLLAILNTVKTPPLMNRTANHKARLLLSPVCGLFVPLPVFVAMIPY